MKIKLKQEKSAKIFIHASLELDFRQKRRYKLGYSLNKSPKIHDPGCFD